MKRNDKEVFENDENYDENEQGLFDSELNEDEIDQDIFMLDDAYVDEGTFNSLTEIDHYDGEDRKVKLKKSSVRKARLSETESARYKASLEIKLCNEIDQKLSLISALDTALNIFSASDRLMSDVDFSDLNTWTDIITNNEIELVVKTRVEDMVNEVVAFYDSIYDEMPRIALEKFSESPVTQKSESFKVTLNSLNLPKVSFKRDDTTLELILSLICLALILKCPPKMCSMCNKEGHLERECPQDFLPELEKLPELTGNWTNTLDSICKHILSKLNYMVVFLIARIKNTINCLQMKINSRKKRSPREMPYWKESKTLLRRSSRRPSFHCLALQTMDSA